MHAKARAVRQQAAQRVARGGMRVVRVLDRRPGSQLRAQVGVHRDALLRGEAQRGERAHRLADGAGLEARLRGDGYAGARLTEAARPVDLPLVDDGDGIAAQLLGLHLRAQARCRGLPGAAQRRVEAALQFGHGLLGRDGQGRQGEGGAEQRGQQRVHSAAPGEVPASWPRRPLSPAGSRQSRAGADGSAQRLREQAVLVALPAEAAMPSALIGLGGQAQVHELSRAGARSRPAAHPASRRRSPARRSATSCSA